MNDRQKALIKFIINHYIKTAEPVSSKCIAEAGKFALSPATIRNEMAELEDQGYIYHPHTSAGRVPSEKGYRFYIENFLNDSNISKKEQEALNQTGRTVAEFEPVAVKQIARQLADFSDNAVIIAFPGHDYYYTGLSNLFAQPEFSQHAFVEHLTKLVEHLDQILDQIFPHYDQEVKIAIGSENPLTKDCSLVITKFVNKNGEGLVAILGPLRMNYQNNLNLVKYTQRLINNLGN